jgi:hypothetical protein
MKSKRRIWLIVLLIAIPLVYLLIINLVPTFLISGFRWLR